MGACVRTRLYLLCTALHVSLSTHFINYFPSSKSFCFSRKKIGEGTRNSAGARALLVAIHKLRVVLIVLRPQLSVDGRAGAAFFAMSAGPASLGLCIGIGIDRAALTLPRVTTDPPCWAGEWSARQPACHTNYVRGRRRAFGISSSTALASSCTGGYK